MYLKLIFFSFIFTIHHSIHLNSQSATSTTILVKANQNSTECDYDNTIEGQYEFEISFNDYLNEIQIVAVEKDNCQIAVLEPKIYKISRTGEGILIDIDMGPILLTLYNKTAIKINNITPGSYLLILNDGDQKIAFRFEKLH